MPVAIPHEVVHIPSAGGAWSRRLVPTQKGARVVAAQWCADGGTSLLLRDGIPVEAWALPVVPAGPRRGRPYHGPQRREPHDGEVLAVFARLIEELAEGEVEAAQAHHRELNADLADWLDYISPERAHLLRYALGKQVLRDEYEAAVRRLSGCRGDDAAG